MAVAVAVGVGSGRPGRGVVVGVTAGWAVGAYFTLTNVTEDDFGEGSFDKGVWIEIPFRWTVPFETRANNSVSLTSVSRDGGAQLEQSNALWPIVRNYSRSQLERNWGSFWQ